ncbi:hypothetical protein BKA70DRAFT_1309354 [Coprinopsis sp. MPI-PUGE-AT-0042]|nr:hypothetical protein BKA70DRAFT_1309354 [Coprinopsis sp. MPI-PUGE-AT-0042]
MRSRLTAHLLRSCTSCQDLLTLTRWLSLLSWTLPAPCAMCIRPSHDACLARDVNSRTVMRAHLDVADAQFARSRAYVVPYEAVARARVLDKEGIQDAAFCTPFLQNDELRDHQHFYPTMPRRGRPPNSPIQTVLQRI